MKKILIALALNATFACAQSVAPETVVATVNGKKVTAKELEDFAKGLPPQAQAAFQQDKEGFLKQYANLMKFANMGVQAKIEETSPYKERFAFQRLQMLASSFIENFRNSQPVSEEEVKAFYEKNKTDFQQAKLQIILVNYSATPAKEGEKPKLTEAAAEARAKEAVAKVRAGLDFKKAVGEYSDDAASKAKDGDFGTIRKTDQIPDDLKGVIFALKAGEVSNPVKQPNGFYVFRVSEYISQPFEELKATLMSQVKDSKFQEWLKVTQETADAKVENQEYFGKAAAPPAAPATTPKPATPAAPKANTSAAPKPAAPAAKKP